MKKILLISTVLASVNLLLTEAKADNSDSKTMTMPKDENMKKNMDKMHKNMDKMHENMDKMKDMAPEEKEKMMNENMNMMHENMDYFHRDMMPQGRK